MADRQLQSEQKKPSNSIKHTEFKVTMEDLLKVRVNAVDEVMPNERAMVCQLQFFDAENAVIETEVKGAFVSPRFGNYIYVRSRSKEEPVLWEQEIIHVPSGANTLRLTLYPWKSSPQLRICEDVECADYRQIGTERKTSTIDPAGINTGQYEILPFWRGVYSFEALKKATAESANADVLISFANAEGNAVECQSDVLLGIVGTVSEHNRTTLLIQPCIEESEYAGFYKAKACIQLLAPSNATSMRTILRVGAQDSRTLVSQNVWAFESLIETQLTAGSIELLNRCESLPIDLRNHSFSTLLEKFPGNPAVYASALDFFLKHNHTEKIVTTANQILNRFHDAELLKSAQHALAACCAFDTCWLPSAGKIASSDNQNVHLQRQEKIAHILYLEGIDDSTKDTVSPISVLSFQKKSGGVSPFAITPDSESPTDGQSTIWRSSKHEQISRYGLNSLSSEEASMVLPTTLLSFSTIIAKQILMNEDATMIHAHGSYREYNFALIALALSRALRVPMVYEVGESTYAEPEDDVIKPGAFEIARLHQDYRCMREAHALILPANAAIAPLSAHGVASEKIFFLPSLSPEKSSSDSKWSQHLGKINDLYLEAYEYARGSMQE